MTKSFFLFRPHRSYAFLDMTKLESLATIDSRTRLVRRDQVGTTRMWYVIGIRFEHEFLLWKMQRITTWGERDYGRRAAVYGTENLSQ